MSDYFSKFPIISYNGVKVRDISRRVAFARKNLADPLVMLPYTVQEGEKPESVAYHYYGSVDYTWLVLMANEIVDPYEGWPMDTETFHRYLMSRYEEESGLTGFDIVAWTQNTQTDDNILFYYKENERGEVMQVDVGTFEDEEEAALTGWVATRIYDYEFELNEVKRNIQLVDSQYKDKIDNEFRRLIAE